MSCTLCTLGDEPGCEACLGAADEPTGEPAPSIVYRIVHVPTGEWYCGKHKLPKGWKDPRECDGYPFKNPSTRTRLAAKLAKYPRSEFRKDVLAVLETEQAALWLEAGLVTEASIRNPKCMNLCAGGVGGLTHLDEEAERRRVERYREVTQTEEWSVAQRRRLARLTEEERRRRIEATRTPKARAKQSATRKRIYAARTDEERRAMTQAARTPVARAKESATKKRIYAEDPKRREQLRVAAEAARTPEALKKRAATKRRATVRRAALDALAVAHGLSEVVAELRAAQRSARGRAAVEGRRRARVERERVRREVAAIFLALVAATYGQA